MTTREEAEQAVLSIISYIEGDAAIAGDGMREGLVRTPERVVESWDTIFSGYTESPKEVLGSQFNSEGYDGIVLLRDVEFTSTCEHHLLPFKGRGHIAYIPTEKIAGVSKLARILETFSRRLQNQERITKQVADALVDNLAPLGAAVILEASHSCMTCRGVQKQHSVMTTSAMRGVFFDKPEARTELLQLIRSNQLPQ